MFPGFRLVPRGHSSRERLICELISQLTMERRYVGDHGHVELCSPPFLCVVLIPTIPERFRICNPYVRDVPGWIAEYVCTAA